RRIAGPPASRLLAGPGPLRGGTPLRGGIPLHRRLHRPHAGWSLFGSDLPGRRRQLARQALRVARRADLREQAVCLAELPLALLLVAALTRQLGELDADQRLQALGLRLTGQLERARKCGLDLPARGRATWSEQHPRQRQ